MDGPGTRNLKILLQWPKKAYEEIVRKTDLVLSSQGRNLQVLIAPLQLLSKLEEFDWIKLSRGGDLLIQTSTGAKLPEPRSKPQ
jgi:hypothetical protein